MEHSKLAWEDVSKFEEIKGYGQHVWRHHEKYFFVTDEGGIAEQRVVYEFPLELFQLLKSGEKTLKEIHFKLKNDCWPPNVTQEEANRNFLRQFPEGLFTKSELGKILPEGAEILASKD